MHPIGFSTGALFKGDFAKGVSAARDLRTSVVELSALRFLELEDLRKFTNHDPLRDFTYISVHAPTDYTPAQEGLVADILCGLTKARHWPVIVHPDCITNFAVWRAFGDLLCIENMDKRKLVGRTVRELAGLFEKLPDAKLCLDIAHAQQVDSTMTEAYLILTEFECKVIQLHVSQVTTNSRHAPLSDSAVEAFRDIVVKIPADIPVILETPVELEDAAREIQQATRIFARLPAPI